MTVKTNLSSTNGHRRFLSEKVGQGIFASQCAALAAAVEPMVRDEEERNIALSAVTEKIRNRIRTPRVDYVDEKQAFAKAHATIHAADKA